ncbi:helix-turn-helix domain-containing protein [Aquabacterium sp. A7-Y]|uniref:helix-turn-helix domain-containing protein n=1 Tax=Aquabacterium sp. A7-Y TaxID=1349605 RepID=UPI00223DA20B|nr:helix-turn-helix transcriptional regulator [Aquabacterium sp. A7-Y]MCW7537979.1 helix-turn-helix domain-containing protein [Aquabacterium sp. A7-Y]
MGLAEAFGRVLRRCRKEAGLTQEALAFEAELERTFVSLLELGQRHPTIGTICKLAAALQMAPHELVKLTEAELRMGNEKRRP